MAHGCTYCGCEGVWLAGHDFSGRVIDGWACDGCRCVASGMERLGLSIQRFVKRAERVERVRTLVNVILEGLCGDSTPNERSRARYAVLDLEDLAIGESEER